MSQQLVDKRDSAKVKRKKVAPHLKSEELNAKEAVFENAGLQAQWNWMFIGLHFGLRPNEIDNLVRDSHTKIELNGKYEISELVVYQTKLTSLSKERRWKRIPIVTDHQRRAVQIIQSRVFKRPLNKTLKRIFDRPIETYSARKGFVDLMKGYGFKFEDIASFMGHADVSTTYRHYKDKNDFTMPEKLKKSA